MYFVTHSRSSDFDTSPTVYAEHQTAYLWQVATGVEPEYSEPAEYAGTLTPATLAKSVFRVSLQNGLCVSGIQLLLSNLILVEAILMRIAFCFESLSHSSVDLKFGDSFEVTSHRINPSQYFPLKYLNIVTFVSFYASPCTSRNKY